MFLGCSQYMRHSYRDGVTGRAISEYPMYYISVLEENLTEIGAILTTNAWMLYISLICSESPKKHFDDHRPVTSAFR